MGVPEMMCSVSDSKVLFRRYSMTYLVVARDVAEFTQGSLVAVGHISTSAKEYQCAGILRQRAPEHFYAALLLAGRNGEEM